MAAIEVPPGGDSAVAVPRELRAVAKGGSVILQSGRDIINGNVFTGSFARLRDVWLDPEPVFDEVQTGQFAGREWLIERIDRFIRRHDRGYIVIQAPAGIGKTMVAAWLAEQRGWPCHFTRRRKGRVAATALRNLAAQIIAGYQLSEQFTPGGMLPETAGEPGWFEQVLRAGAAAATAAGQRLVLVVDGLDEAETFEGDLPLGLPTRLPRGVIMVVTCRTGSRLLGMRLPWEMTTFDLADERNLADMRLFLQRTAEKDAEIVACLSGAGMSGDEFVDQLVGQCGGVWVYLRYILDALRLGLRSPLDLEELPSDLVGYYTEALWPSDDDDDQARTRLLVTLAAVTEPLPVAVLAELAGLPETADVERLCAEQMRPFLTCTVDDRGVRRYGIYHVSLRDYLHGANPEPMLEADRNRADRLGRLCRDAHSRIADLYLDAFGGLRGGLPLLAVEPTLAGRHGGYALRNVALHLERAQREDDLHRLLETAGDVQNVWYAAHDRAGTLVDYVTDIRRAKRLVAADVDADLLTGRPPSRFGLELRYMMMQAAIVSLTNNVPPTLVVRAVEHGVWNVERALGHARQLRSATARAGLLGLLLPRLSTTDHAAALAEAIGIARNEDAIDSSWIYMQVVTSHPLPVPETLLRDAMTAATSVQNNDRHLAWVLAEMAPRLGPLLNGAIDLASGVDPEGRRVWLLKQLIPHLADEQYAQVIALGQAFTDDYERANLIEAIAAPSTMAPAKGLLALARSIETADDRAAALAAVAECLPPHDRAPVVAEALAAARACEDTQLRARALAAVAAASPDDEQADLFREAVAAAADVADVIDRVWALADVAWHLDGEERKRVAAECLDLAATAESDDDRVMMAVAAGTVEAGEASVDRICAFATSIADGPARARLLYDLAVNCHDDGMEKVLTTIRTTLDLVNQAAPLTALARRATPELSSKILDDAARLPSAYLRFEVLDALAPRLPSALLSSALDAVRSITDEYGRALLLARLSERLPERGTALFQEAVTTAQRITHDPGRVDVLGKLARQTPEPQRTALLTEALSAALRVEPHKDRFFALANIVDQLDGDPRRSAVSAALASARADEFDGPRSYALGEIARLTPTHTAELLQEAISAARQHPDEGDRPMLLAEVVGRMPPTPERTALLHEATALARNASAGQPHAIQVALRIIDLLPESMIVKSLAAVRELIQGDEVPQVVGELIRFLPGPLLAEAIDAIIDLPARLAPRTILGVMVPYLPQRLRETALKQLLSASNAAVARRSVITHATRAWPTRIGVTELDIIRRCLDGTDLDDCLDLLAAASDLLERIAGDDVHPPCLDALRAVEHWWPHSPGESTAARFADHNA